MSEIVIPFKEEFKGRMLAGIKTATSRTKLYGFPGDRFKAFGSEFEIEHITETTIKNVAIFWFKHEGFESERAFVQKWNEIHPRKTYQADKNRMVWLHLFRRIK